MALGLWRASAYGSCSLRLLPLVLVLLCQVSRGEGATGLCPRSRRSRAAPASTYRLCACL